MDIEIGEFVTSIQVANKVLRYWSMRPSVVRWVAIVILVSLEKHFIRVCENIH